MRHLARNLLASLLFGALLAPSALAEVRPQKLAIEVKAGSTAICPTLAESLRFHFKSRQRFATSEGSVADHVVTLACDTEYVDARWMTRVTDKSSKSELMVASVRVALAGDVTTNHPSLALALTRQLLAKLPWDGEVNGLLKPLPVKGKSPMLGPASKTSVHTMANTAAGYFESAAVTDCAPFEIALVKNGPQGVLLEVIGEGAFSSVGTFASPAEIYLDRKVPAGGLPVFRLILSSDARRDVRQLVARCKKAIGDAESESEGGSMSRLMAGNLGRSVSQESIEINMVQQRAGGMAGQFAATNGVKAPFSVLGYAHSRADIGELLAVDGRAIRSLLSKPYQGVTGVDAPAPEITIAEVFTMFRFDWDDLSLTAGPGLFLSKVNLPYGTKDAPVESGSTTGQDDDVLAKPNIRPATAHPALAFGLRSDIGRFIFDSQLSGSQPNKDHYLALEVALNLRLTDTWFMGGNAMVMQLSEQASGATGGRLTAVGGHVGFELKRTRQERGRK